MFPGRGRGDTRGERHSNYHLRELRNCSPEIWKSSLKHFLPPLTSAHWISLLIPSTHLYSLMALSRLWYSHFSQDHKPDRTAFGSSPEPWATWFYSFSVSQHQSYHLSALEGAIDSQKDRLSRQQVNIERVESDCFRACHCSTQLLEYKKVKLQISFSARVLLVPRALQSSVCPHVWESRGKTAYKVGQRHTGGEAESSV